MLIFSENKIIMYKYFLKKENVMKLLHNNQIDNAYVQKKQIVKKENSS